MEQKIIIGSVIGGVVIIAIIIGIVMWMKSKSSTTPSTSNTTTPAPTTGTSGNLIMLPPTGTVTTDPIVPTVPAVVTYPIPATNTTMSIADISTQYGSEAGRIVTCTRQFPQGGSGLQSCMVPDSNYWCTEQGLQGAPSCGGCGYNISTCENNSTVVIPALVAAGLIPKYYP